jgi:hypothetical protein
VCLLLLFNPRTEIMAFLPFADVTFHPSFVVATGSITVILTFILAFLHLGLFGCDTDFSLKHL